MLTIYHSPGRRSVRPIWLCYELELPVAVQLIDCSAAYRASAEWRAISPAGTVPAMRDGELVMVESGVMLDYLLERYGAGRPQPERGTAASALHHQLCWFAESTLLRPLGAMRVLRARRHPETLVDDAEQKIVATRAAGRTWVVCRHARRTSGWQPWARTEPGRLLRWSR